MIGVDVDVVMYMYDGMCYLMFGFGGLEFCGGDVDVGWLGVFLVCQGIFGYLLGCLGKCQL